MLYLNAGSKVRNIRNGSVHYGYVGFVESIKSGGKGDKYLVLWSDGKYGSYFTHLAHHSLQPIDETSTLQPTKQVLYKERVNVITGGTLSEAKKQLGDVRAFPEFHTRATGRTTGQAFGLISKAMLNPYMSHDMRGIDHHQNGTRHPDEHFIRMVKDLTKDLKGFSFTQHSIMFSPIVTQETYVEVR